MESVTGSEAAGRGVAFFRALFSVTLLFTTFNYHNKLPYLVKDIGTNQKLINSYFL